jgi:hypothetical protein
VAKIGGVAKIEGEDDKKKTNCDENCRTGGEKKMYVILGGRAHRY